MVNGKEVTMHHTLHPLKSLIIATVSLLLAVSALAAAAVPVKLVGVSDGDTVTVVMDGQQTKIRLYGIDAPEKAQPYGQVSTEAMKRLTTGHDISVQAVDRDRYGRTVGLVFADGISVNEAMVKSGNAWVYRQYCTQPFCSEWELYQNAARTSRSGLWQDNAPMPPWEWRHGGKAGQQGSGKQSVKPDAAGGYSGNVDSRKFHSAGCRYANCKNCTATFATRDQAIAAGYVPCKVCNP
jgi:endonuclease YncB( thermonuclease family)